MAFELTAEQAEIRDQMLKLCASFGDEYWLRKDREGTFPEEFHAAMAKGGWLGIAMPEQYGGGGLGITEAAVMMQAVAESGACMTGASESDPMRTSTEMSHMKAMLNRPRTCGVMLHGRTADNFVSLPDLASGRRLVRRPSESPRSAPCALHLPRGRAAASRRTQESRSADC